MQARWKSLFQKNMLTENERFGLTRLQEQGDFRLLPGCCYDTATNLEAWLPADTVWVLPGLSDFRDMLSSAERLWTEAFEAQDVEAVLSRSVWPCAKQAMWKALASGSPVFTQNRW